MMLSTLRESRAAMISFKITGLSVYDRGLQADEATLTTIWKRIGVCIQTCVTQGVLECAGETPVHGAFGPCKLWRLKRGG